MSDPAMIDHAELARLAGAATQGLASGNWRPDPYGIVQIWGDSLKGGDTMIAMVRGWGYLTGGGHGALGKPDNEASAIQAAWAAFIAAANPARVLALLAEIAALRGEKSLDEIAAQAEVDEHAGRSLDWQIIAASWKDRATQAERQRDEAVGHIETAASSAEYQCLVSPEGESVIRWKKTRDFHRAFLASMEPKT